MATLEERVAFLEGRVVEHSPMIEGIRDAIVSLEHRMDRRFEAIDRRFESIERRLDGLGGQMGTLDGKIDRARESLDTRMSRQFMWLVGIQMTLVIAVVAALLSR